jgi:hypothetical protein
VTKVVNLAERRAKKQGLRGEGLLALMDFEYSDTDLVDQHGNGYLGTPEEQEQFQAYCAAFGFDVADFHTPDELFGLWRSLAGDLASFVQLYIEHPDTFDILTRRRPENWTEYVRAVATGDSLKTKRLKDGVVDLSWRKKSRP